MLGTYARQGAAREAQQQVRDCHEAAGSSWTWHGHAALSGKLPCWGDRTYQYGLWMPSSLEGSPDNLNQHVRDCLEAAGSSRTWVGWGTATIISGLGRA